MVSIPVKDKLAKISLTYSVRIIPNTVNAETAATPNAKFLFFSVFFS